MRREALAVPAMLAALSSPGMAAPTEIKVNRHHYARYS